MKIIIIGAGASGITAAINYKRHHKDDDVLVIEHLDKPLKKILATGNGKCNLGNSNIDFKRYNEPDYALNVIKNYDYVSFFNSISIQTKLIGDLAYPVSESSVSVREALLNECRKLKIKINVSESLLDYEFKCKIIVLTNKNTYECDKLYLAGSLCSSPKLGSDGSLIQILKKHNYNIVKPEPGLSPLYTVEKTKELDGVRFKGEVKLYSALKLVHKEDGEILFKDHGLSGIVIFNMMSIISRNPNQKYKIVLDLLPEYDKNYLDEYVKTHSVDEFLLAFINPKISEYLKHKSPLNADITNLVKNLEFTFDKSYGFDFSQVSVGGVDLKEVDENLMSKKESNVYLIGELLNVDGPCGGYNLTWAFASALKATLWHINLN